MEHSFDVSLATQHGINAAILFQNILFWINKNKANDKHFYDDAQIISLSVVKQYKEVASVDVMFGEIENAHPLQINTKGESIMKHMKEVYDAKDCSWYDYNPMIKSFGEVVVQVDERDYQGDTWVLLRGDDGQYGYLAFGWGSCSGCDALQACDTIEEVNNLAESLYDSIQWYSTKESFSDWFNTHDFEGDWTWHKEEFHQFVREVKEFLNSGSTI